MNLHLTIGPLVSLLAGILILDNAQDAKFYRGYLFNRHWPDWPVWYWQSTFVNLVQAAPKKEKVWFDTFPVRPECHA